MKEHNRRRLSLSTVSAIVIIGLATLLRVILIIFHYPTTMSDESIIDLMAKHIAYNGAHPIFFYGQAYMGPLEAYLGALFYYITGGPSVIAVRLGLVLINTLFLITMYFLTRLLYTRVFAVAVAFLLALGSSDIVSRELRAIGGYPELLLFGAIILLLTVLIAYHAPRTRAELAQQTARQRWQRVGLYSALGFCAGLGLYTEQLTVTFAIVALAFLVCFCWREILSLPILCGIITFLLGMAPMIYYNIAIIGTQAHSTLHDIINVQQSTTQQIQAEHIPSYMKLVGTFLFSLPAITGFNPACSTSGNPGSSPTVDYSLACNVTQSAWSLGFLILLFGAIIVASIQLLHIWYKQRALRQAQYTETVEGERTAYQEVIRQSGRIMVLLSALATLLLYITSASPATNPVDNDRYLLGLLVATPALLWPLWNGFTQDRATALRGPWPTLAIRIAALGLILVMFLNGTIGILKNLPQDRATFAKQQAFAGYLHQLGVTHLYTDYWLCYRMAFQTNESIPCVSLTYTLVPGGPTNNRISQYVREVEASNQVTYAMPSGSWGARNLQHVASTLGTKYKKYIYGGYDIYQFDKPVNIPRR